MNTIQLSIEKKYYGRVLNTSEIKEIQDLQIHLANIVDMVNNKNCNRNEDTVNYISNACDEGLNTLFKIRYKLTGV